MEWWDTFSWVQVVSLSACCNGRRNAWENTLEQTRKTTQAKWWLRPLKLVHTLLKPWISYCAVFSCFFFFSHSGWLTWLLHDSSHSRQLLGFLFRFSLFGQYIYTYVQKHLCLLFFFFSFFYNFMWFTKQDSKITYKEYEYCTKIKLIKLLGVDILQCYRSLVCRTAFWSMCPVWCMLA